MQVSFSCDVQSLNILHIFFIFPSSSPDSFSKQLRPSSLYNLIFFPTNSVLRILSKYKPTNSHTSAPSKLPIVTSNFGLSFLTQISLLVNKSDFLESTIVSITFSSILVIVLAKLMTFVNKSFEIDG